MTECLPDVRISVVTTIRNEAASIGPFLRSLLKQSMKPDEIMLVDGGSTDDTVAIIRDLARNEPSIRLVVAAGVNISKGRNIGIEAARNGIIACTDAGCRLDARWLENITAPFRRGQSVAVVGGVYLPEGNLFQRCIGAMLTPDISTLDPSTFLPSSRSVAFTKSAWRAVGGYPEWLDMAEDTYFDIALRKHGFAFALARDAVVYWDARDSYTSIFFQFFKYAYWNMIARVALKTERKKIILYLAALVLLAGTWYSSAALYALTAGMIAYTLHYSFRAYRYIHDRKVFLLVPLITVVKEAGSLSGYVRGGIDRFIRRSAP